MIDNAVNITSELHDPNARNSHLRNKKKRLNREHRCSAGWIPSEGQVRTILTTLECYLSHFFIFSWNILLERNRHPCQRPPCSTCYIRRQHTSSVQLLHRSSYIFILFNDDYTYSLGCLYKQWIELLSSCIFKRMLYDLI